MSSFSVCHAPCFSPQPYALKPKPFVLGIVAFVPPTAIESNLASACIAAHAVGLKQILLSCGKLLQFSIQEACTSTQLHAAAALRATTFYNYPEERSEEARKSHEKYMTAVEWRTLQSKVSGTEMGYGRVVCLIAISPVKDFPIRSRGLLEVITVSGEPMFVIGTLDVNQGRVLPGEIQGLRPEGSDADRGRGYIANFCVAEETRRKGVGMTLIKEAQKMAKEWGIVDLYVHVVASNNSALNLYLKNGFTMEREESISDARALARPRRLLLWRSL